MRQIRVGGSKFYVADDDIEIILVRPNERDVYALDMAPVPDPDQQVCGDAVEGSGVQQAEGGSVIVFDCGDGGTYAHYNLFGAPAHTNVPGATQRLPAYRVEVMDDGALILLDRRIGPAAILTMWGMEG